MKQGKSLSELAVELENQLASRRDFVAPAGAVKVVSDENKNINVHGITDEALGITGTAHDQFADYTGIPRKYYNRMLISDGQLLTHNVNHWLQNDPMDSRLFRTMNGNVRAVLSASYRRLDNYELAKVAMPVFKEKECQVVSCEVTETRMYLKAILPGLSREVPGSKKKGDIVQAGIAITNSEIGLSSLKVEPLLYRLVCTNGMIANDRSMRKYHIGRQIDAEGVRELLSDEAKEADDLALWLKVRDVIRGAFDADIFNAIVEKAAQAAGNEIVSKASLPKVIEVTAKRFALPDSHRDVILSHLIQDQDLSQWGLVNAVTRTAEDVRSYDLATTFERVGGEILALNRDEWQDLTQVAA